MAIWAKPGVKCVCVDARPGFASGLPVPFRKGQVLVIREIISGGLRFYGIPDVDPRDRKLTCYAASRFRPLVTRTQEQDVAKFRHLLAPSGVEVDV